jgi:predicted NAD/FAD-binding protein
LKKKVAVIGSGIAGLVSSHLLSENYDVSLFEADNYLGGHTHTIDIKIDNVTYPIDTGFIVFNKKTYPNFCKLLQKHDILIQKSEMSFSYRSNLKDIEYNGHNLNTLFADRRNLLKPQFYHFLREILRFNKNAKIFLLKSPANNMTIQNFIDQQKYSKDFIEHYLLPLIASIWSKTNKDIMQCSAHFILKFCENHGLLDAYNRPEWYVIANGSRSYIPALIENIKNNIFLNTRIESVTRQDNQVILKSATDKYIFDMVVIATHSDQALKLLIDPSNEEKTILSAIAYSNNEVILHTDKTVMPKRRLAWASWNYFDNDDDLPTLTLT